MTKISDFTEGKILSPLLKFAMPVLLAMFLQVMYGAVDLLIVGQFGSAIDVSAVATGSQVMMTITSIINGFAMGVTILMGQKLGQGKYKEAGNVVGSGICIFTVLAVIITAAMLIFAVPISRLMHAPVEAFDDTVLYVRICSAGTIFIVAYNVICGIFRGLGDSKTPLITVSIACVANILGDILLVVGFHMNVAGVAIATVFAQAISVLLSIIIINKRGLPFEFSKSCVRFHKGLTSQILKYGAPIALQDGLVNLSFLAITTIVNSLGVIASAGVGVAEKLAGFIMLVPSAFAQSVAAFVAQNYGAKKYTRAKKTLAYGIGASICFGVVMAYLTFFHGNLLSGMFSKDVAVINASWDYMKAYAIDCLLTSFLFSMIGFFNGCGKTTFVMFQGIFGAFCIRIPLSYMISKVAPTSLFYIGLATPSSTFVQVVFCLVYFIIVSKNYKKRMDIENENHF
ncbi:MATE family efflux transporter [Anaerocolumna cellulosilytica]|uniref:Probable multidrug resistance protein NorM n=1 Tax=Anaerocolumna cellulosilytica TaxID=433286 RepID=A0A6S6QXK3_9FIRM|nr:MATE family efflux transporter [Anaerocolumna cellulosilytica]MBB5195546.1 putative MATE family efflux protein [Anaerocolumna cellulosilytica]BCJ93789.1 MATE family efflux transporter [Anaerocolumna cellulosilytica]